MMIDSKCSIKTCNYTPAHTRHAAAGPAGANITCSDNKCSVSVGLYHNAAYQINFCIVKTVRKS